MSFFLLALFAAAPPENAPRAVFADKEEWAVEWFALSPDGLLLFTSNGRELICAWDLATGKKLAPFRCPERTSIEKVPGLSQDGKTLVTACGHHWNAKEEMVIRVMVWDVATREEKFHFDLLPRKGPALWKIKVSPDARKLAAYNYFSETILLYDITAQKQTGLLKIPKFAHPSRLAFSPDGQLVATGHDTGAVELWDGATGKPVATLAAHIGNVLSLAFSADGKTLASGGRDKTVYLWDVPTRKRKGDLNAPTLIGEFRALAFSPDGKTLATAGRIKRPDEGRDAGCFVLWNLETGQPRDDFRLPAVSVGHWAKMQFSPDGKTLATCDVLPGNYRGVQLWDVPERKPRPKP